MQILQQPRSFSTALNVPKRSQLRGWRSSRQVLAPQVPPQLWRASARLLLTCQPRSRSFLHPGGRFHLLWVRISTQATPIPSYSRASAGWKQHGHEPELPANPAGAWAQAGPDVPSAASSTCTREGKRQASTPPAPQERKPGLRAAGSALPQPSPCLQASRSPR